MAFPPDIATRVVTLGGAMSIESSALLKVRVTVSSSKSLVWDATGYRFERVPDMRTSELGSEVSFILPRTDVSGWKDAETNQLIDVSAPNSYTHRYTAAVEILDDKGRVVRKDTMGPFVIPEGEGPIDLDKTVPASTVAGDVIAVPDLWGQLVTEAQTAAEEAAQAATDATGAVAPVAADVDDLKTLTTTGRLSETGLDTHIVQVVSPDYARLARMLEGVPLVVYGDSQAKNPSQGADAGTQFSDRLNGRQRFRSYDNRGVAGTTMGEIASAVVASWVANSRGLVLACSGIGNTSTQWGADGQPSAARAFRTILALLTSRARFAPSSTTFAFGAAWSAGTSSTAGSFFDVGVNGDSAHLILNTATGAGGVIEVRDGSTLVATINTGGYKAVFPAAFKVSGLGAGDHILRATLVSGTATVVGLAIPSSTPAQVAWVTVEPSRANVAQRQSYVDACAAVLADFPSVLHVTPGDGWDPTQHVSDEDGLHLNDRGNAFMADRIEAVLATELDFSQGLNRLSRSTAAAAYTGPIPAPIVVVTTYSSDSFDRANGALGVTEVGGQAWALSVASSVSIVDNGAEWATAASTQGTVAYVDDGQALGKVTAEGVNGSGCGIFLAGDASLNGYYFFHSNSNGWRIGIRTPSGFTPLATGGATAFPGGAVTLDLVRGAAGALTGYVNGVAVVTATDTTYAGTRHGIISLSTGRRVTAWRHTDS